MLSVPVLRLPSQFGANERENRLIARCTSRITRHASRVTHERSCCNRTLNNSPRFRLMKDKFLGMCDVSVSSVKSDAQVTLAA